MKEKNMIYTEKHHIALGQAIRTENGEYALRIKRDNKYDVMSMSKLIAQIIRIVDATA